jgi:glycosyltransferase involved in cell wall biosynthesis
MKVSILIPTFNRRALLEESLQSARAQTHEDLEILVSDNGSSDDTCDLVTRTAAIDPRVRLLPVRPSAEMFANFNYLIDQSRGDAFCILADDDRLAPQFVATLIQPLANDPTAAAAFCDHWLISERGARLVEASAANTRRYGRNELPPGRVADPIAVALRQSISVVFAVYRASVFREHFDIACGGAADIDYAIRAARVGALYYVGARLGEYRVHRGTITATRTAFMIDGTIRAYRKHGFGNPLHEEIRLERLRAACRTKAVFACTRSRRDWWEALSVYRQCGGGFAHADVILSCALVLLPHGTGEALRRGLKAIRAWSSHAARPIPEPR